VTSSLLLVAGERERLSQLASSCAPSEWVMASHAGEILKCFDEGVLPSPEAIEWFLMYFRKRTR